MKAIPTDFEAIASLRDSHRKEMACQIVHDSLHQRANWAQPYLLQSGSESIGYGSILNEGPWQGTRTVFEFYLVPSQRIHTFKGFETFISESKATAITSQTNDPILTPLFYSFIENAVSEKIVFEDLITTSESHENIVFRKLEKNERSNVFDHKHEPIGDWALVKGGEIVGTGGFMTHYNPPYVDIFMEVSEPHRSKGYGTFLVQELKTVCYKLGKIPCCRCDLDNVPSIKTIQRSGFIPCAHILTGKIKIPKKSFLANPLKRPD